MSHRFLFLSLILLIALTLLPAVTTQPFAANAEVKGIQTTAVRFTHPPNTPDPNEIFTLVNQTRRAEGLPPLAANEQLAQVARERAQDMAGNHYYAHQNSEGKYYYDLMEQQGIVTTYSCENLDMEFSHLALTYVADWLGSTQGHKQCLLNSRITQAGYAVVELEPQKTSDAHTYIIVAIHATEPGKR